MNRNILRIFGAIIFLFLCSNVSAKFYMGNASYSIPDSFSQEETITGWINISFSNESSSSLVSSNMHGNKSLLDFLNENNADFSCYPADCNKNYKIENPENSKSFTLSNGQEKIISVVLRGKIQEILNLNFSLSSSNSESCRNPLEIDLLDDNSTEFYSNNFGDSYSCMVNNGYGCFDSSSTIEYVSVTSTPYCEKVTLPQSGKFKIGAWIKGKDSYSNNILKMSLYDLDSELVASCNLQEPIETGSEIGCIVNYSNKELQDFYVCISSDKQTDYKIKKEEENSCGFYGFPGTQEEYYDYSLFAKGAKFEAIGTLNINNQAYENWNYGGLNDYLSSYVSERYENNCTPACVIPIKFISHGDVSINLNNLSLQYSTTSGMKDPETNFYQTAEKSPQINSDYLILDISKAGMSTTRGYGNSTLIIYVGDTAVLSKRITILKSPIINYVSPYLVSAGANTQFFASVSSQENKSIAKYVWDFGDNTTLETTSPYVNHIYSEIKDYNLRLEVFDSSGISSKKEFVISSGNPAELINYTIKEYKARISNISRDAASMVEWKREIEDKLNISQLSSELNSLEASYLSSTSSEKNLEIMNKLSLMKIPMRIIERKLNEVDYFFNKENIKVEDVAKLSNENVSGEEYKDAIATWVVDNLNLKESFTGIYGEYDSGEELILGEYSIKINPKAEDKKTIYLIISGDAKLNSGYQTRKLEQDTAVITDSSAKEIKFVSSNSDIANILYVSPKLEEAKKYLGEIEECNQNNVCEEQIGETKDNCDDCKSNKRLIAFIILGIFVVLCAIALVWWYRTRYERYLFKNRADMLNLKIFIENAKKTGMSNSQIIEVLKKNGSWTREQITYVLKKMGIIAIQI